MAETPAQERTERPTQRRLTQARDEGQVPRTPELSAAAVLLAGAAVLAWVGTDTLGRGAIAIFRNTVGSLRGDAFTAGDATALIRAVSRGAAIAIAPFLAIVFVTALLVNLGQAQGVWSLKPLQPQWSRISPAAGLGRLLGAQGWLTLVKSILKVTLLAIMMVLILRSAWPSLTSLIDTDPYTVASAVRRVTLHLTLYAGFGFLVLAGADYGVAVWRHQRQLRMTRQELIQEFRETEGDPVRKVRMRSLAAALVRRRMLHKVKQADVVIVNPTHIAVAIHYDGIAPAPIVVAMGQRKLAERIVFLARQANVPVVQNIPVARALFSTARIGAPIPAALYAAVAQVLAFVYKQRGRLPQALADVRMA